MNEIGCLQGEAIGIQKDGCDARIHHAGECFTWARLNGSGCREDDYVHGVLFVC